MADSKITDLTLATTITGDDVLPIVNGGSTKKVTVTKIKEGLATTTYVDTQDNLKVDKVAGSRLITSAESTLLGNTSGTNTGDNATNSQYSGLATSKYDASNPSGYQTAGQVQTIADAKVVQTITNGATATAPSQDAVFDALATRQATLISGTNIRTINGNTLLGSTDLVISGGGGATNLTTSQTVSNFTINSDTGTDASVPLGNGTLAGATLNNFSNTDKTKLDGLTQVQVINDSEFVTTSNTFSSQYVDTEIINLTLQKASSYSGGYSFQANTGSGAGFGFMTEQAFRLYPTTVYNLTPTWSGTTNPTVLLGNSYSGQQVGNMVSINIALVYSTSGLSNTQVILPLPIDLPTPYSPTGLTGALDIIAYGTGMILANTTSIAVTGARNTLLRRNSANTGYEFLMNISAAVAARVAIMNLTYQTS